MNPKAEISRNEKIFRGLYGKLKAIELATTGEKFRADFIVMRVEIAFDMACLTHKWDHVANGEMTMEEIRSAIVYLTERCIEKHHMSDDCSYLFRAAMVGFTVMVYNA